MAKPKKMTDVPAVDLSNLDIGGLLSMNTDLVSELGALGLDFQDFPVESARVLYNYVADNDEGYTIYEAFEAESEIQLWLARNLQQFFDPKIGSTKGLSGLLIKMVIRKLIEAILEQFEEGL